MLRGQTEPSLRPPGWHESVISIPKWWIPTEESWRDRIDREESWRDRIDREESWRDRIERIERLKKEWFREGRVMVGERGERDEGERRSLEERREGRINKVK